MENWVIETQELTRYYGDFKAVDDLSLRVPVNSIYGFFGTQRRRENHNHSHAAGVDSSTRR